MAKAKPSAASFLEKMAIEPEEIAAPAAPKAPVVATPARTKRAPAETIKKAQKGREGLKHVGAYFDRDTVEIVAILRARLGLDNSQLLKRAVEELYARETAARKFGDR